MTETLSARSSRPEGFAADASSPLRLWWIELGSTTVAIGILVQATLAGQIIAGSHWLVTAHRIVAEFLPLLSVGLIVVAWMDRRANRSAATLVVSLGVALALLIVQTGTGFVARNAIGAIAVHVPLGVALLGLYVAIAMHARHLRLQGAAPEGAAASAVAP